MFFVVSTGRCGSKSIARFLSKSPDCVCVHEAEPKLIAEATRYLYGSFDHSRLAEILRSTRSPMLDGKQYGESNHKLSFLIPALREVFPQAKFVWLIRDGRDTVASMYGRGWYSGVSQFVNDPKLMQWERYRLRADKLGEMSKLAWCNLSRFEKCCWYWAHKNWLIEEALRVTQADWVLIRLEEIEEEGGKLFDFLEIAHPRDARLSHLNRSRSGDNPLRWELWDIEKREAFAHYSSHLMDDHYPSWRQEVARVWDAPAPVKGYYWIREYAIRFLQERVRLRQAAGGVLQFGKSLVEWVSK